MYRLLYLLGMVGCLFLGACQEKEEGCMDPRAENFDPEADAPSEAGCNYYQLEVIWQHYSANTPADTLNQGGWLVDAAGQFYYFERCDWLGSSVRLKATGSNATLISPSKVLLYERNGAASEVENNFFLMSLNQFNASATGWVDLGDFDEVSFKLGLDPSLETVNPSRTPIQGHPLSATASPYLYDSTQQAFNTLQMVVIQPNNNNRRFVINVDSDFDFNFPYMVSAVDGQGVPIRIRLNYDILMAGIAFDSDPILSIERKLEQNIPAAFSVY